MIIQNTKKDDVTVMEDSAPLTNMEHIDIVTSSVRVFD